MCLSKTFNPISPSTSSTNMVPSSSMKRPHSSMTSTSSGSSSNLLGTSPQQHKKLKKSQSSSSKSVQFSQSVSMRCFFANNDGQQVQQDDANTSSKKSLQWVTKDDVDKNKSQAKTLCQLHHYVRKNKKTRKVTIANSVRYEFKGESLRGMEYLTDNTNGRKRRSVRESAMKACAAEQQEQLIAHVLDSALSACTGTSTEERVMSEALKMDSSKLAKAYGSNTQESLSYARRVALEDAKIAAEILAEDLNQSTMLAASANASKYFSSVKSTSSCNKKSAMKASGNNQSVAANIIRSFLPGTMSRHRNMTSMQA